MVLTMVQSDWLSIPVVPDETVTDVIVELFWFKMPVVLPEQVELKAEAVPTKSTYNPVDRPVKRVWSMEGTVPLTYNPLIPVPLNEQ